MPRHAKTKWGGVILFAASREAVEEAARGNTLIKVIKIADGNIEITWNI